MKALLALTALTCLATRAAAQTGAPAPATTASLAGYATVTGGRTAAAPALFTNAVSVSLSAANADGTRGGLSTFYALDGGGAQTYAAPFAVAGAGIHLLTFWSVDEVGDTEAKHTLPLTVVGLVAATVTLKTSLSAAVYGQAVTLTATVAPAKSGGGMPTGTVTVSEGGTALGTAPLSAGAATLPLPALPVGYHTLTAAYSGDAAFLAAASAALTQKISQSATTVTLTASAPTARLGHAVTFTFTVSPSAPGGGVPTGSITFFDKYHPNVGPLALTGGQATFSTSSLIVGAHSLSAAYSGDSNFVKSYSAPLTQTMTAVKIMPMGDGLTAGYSTHDPAAQASGGYRGPLYAQTVGQGWAVQYVGGVVQGFGIGYCEGHAGWTIEMAQAREPALVTKYQPDVILLMSGISDLENTVPAAQMLTNTGTLLDALSAAKPGVQILVASLTPLDAPSVDPAQESAFNAGLPGVAQQAASRGDNVSFVDMNALCAWTASDYQPPAADGVHPNSSGYAKMAAVWYNTLAALPLAH